MKTLDEVIACLDGCGRIDCDDCPYHYEDEKIEVDDCAQSYKDALHYLKEYRDECNNIVNVHDDYIRLRNEMAEELNKANPPLTWDELKSMEGKPVWAVVDGKERWRIIREVSSEHLIFESGLPLHRCWMNHPDGWQAYRKERK